MLPFHRGLVDFPWRFVHRQWPAQSRLAVGSQSGLYSRQSRDAGAVRTKAVYLAIGVNMAGHKEVLGLWIAQTEGAKFWLQVVTELKTRGVQDIFIACVDGLKGFPEAIEAVYSAWQDSAKYSRSSLALERPQWRLFPTVIFTSASHYHLP